MYCGSEVDQEAKAITEAKCMASVGEAIPTSTIMNMSIAVAFKNIDRDAFLADLQAQSTAILTLSNFISGIPLNRMRIITITTLSSRRLRSGGDNVHNAAVIGSLVTYRVSVALEELGYDSTQSEAAFNSIVTQVDQSIQYGQFQATLVLNSNHAGSNFMDAVVVDQPSQSSIESVSMVITVAPTSMPSPVPVPSDDELSEGDVIAISILVPLAVIGIAAGAYYWFMIRKTGDGKKGDKKSFLEMGGSSSLGVDTSAGAKFDDL
jgi:hypothetical protein